MPTTLQPLPTLIDVLAAGRAVASRPDHGLVAGIRAALADAFYERFGAVAPQVPLVLRASSLRAEHTTVPIYSPAGRLRGALVTHLLRVHAVGFTINDPFHDAVTAWRASEYASQLADAFDELDDDERARLATDVTAHAVTLLQRLGTVPSSWRPRTAVRSSIRLAGGSLILKDHVDVVVGSNNGQGTGVALVDVTTASLDASLESALRYHALVETLRTTIAPRYVAALSTATGEVVRLVVDDEVIGRALNDVVGAFSRAEVAA